jgi:integrase
VSGSLYPHFLKGTEQGTDFGGAIMPKVLSNALTAATVKNARPGRHCDGGGLFLLVKDTGKRSWLFRYKLNGKVRDMGLGGASGAAAVSLPEVRGTAGELRKMAKAGIDPLAERERKAVDAAAKAQAQKVRAMTFKAVAAAYIEAHEAGWRNAKHRAQWTSTLTTYAYPQMGELPVSNVATADVMAALAPIWAKKPETASRLRGRIEAVLDYAKASGWRDGENPARWRGHIANLLPTRGKVARVEHHAALPWAESGAFMAALRLRDATAARALEFAILTAARTGEVLGARWREIDRVGKVWTLPGARMKAGREHRVPLSKAAVAVLDDMAKLRPDDDAKGEAFIFPGARAAHPLSQMAMLMLLRRMDRGDLTAHGFRSTFRDWCAEATAYPHEMAEIALAHVVADKTEAAYRRGDMMDRRRRMMDDWAEFCAKPAATGDNVRVLRGAA